MNEDSKDNNDEILSSLIDKQINKIIENNEARDSYFSIRQNFDLDQFLWDIATHIYSAIGEKIDFAKTRDLLKQCQESAYQLRAKEQKKQREEQEKIYRDKIQARIKTIYQQIELLYKEQEKDGILLKIAKLKEELLDLFAKKKEGILSDFENALRDDDYNLACKLQSKDLASVELDIKNTNQDLSKIYNEIELKANEIKLKEDLKDNYFLSIVKQVEGGSNKEEILIKILKLIESELEVDYQCMNLDSHISNDLGADELDTIELSAEIEELTDIEIPDELLGAYHVGGLSSGHSYPVACSIKEILQFISSNLTQSSS